jgi:hypothetical protein
MCAVVFSVPQAVRALTFVEVESESAETAIVALSMTSEHATITWAAELAIAASLPEGDGKISLKPQRGIANVEAALGEIHVHDEAVDAAWVIHGSEPALLIAAVPELRALARFAPSVDVDRTSLTISFGHVDDASAIAAALSLLHRAVFFRMGVS